MKKKIHTKTKHHALFLGRNTQRFPKLSMNVLYRDRILICIIFSRVLNALCRRTKSNTKLIES